ncbi:MAG: hypothetical protein JNJ82_09480 [Opitutaceae bacterium]|nr:hypothetical protein [Opitutaceae bacterium]
MTLFRWLPVILVLPTFAFIGYWIWRYLKTSDKGKLPRTREELKRGGSQLGEEFAAAGNRLRWFNLWLFLVMIAAAIGISAYNTWIRR